MGDPIERTSLARALVQAQCEVIIVVSAEHDPAELGGAEILIADFDASEVYGIVDAMRRLRPDLPIVAWTSRTQEVERGLTALKYAPFEVHGRTTRIPDLIDAVKRLAGA
jgi:hypothetical protein